MSWLGLTSPVLADCWWAPQHLDCLWRTVTKTKNKLIRNNKKLFELIYLHLADLHVHHMLTAFWLSEAAEEVFTWWILGRWGCRAWAQQHRSASIAGWGGNSHCGEWTGAASASSPYSTHEWTNIEKCDLIQQTDFCGSSQVRTASIITDQACVMLPLQTWLKPLSLQSKQCVHYFNNVGKQMPII